MNKLNETKKRIALLIEYNGNGFVGWQKQNNGQSVQNLIESSFENLFQLKFNVQAAGRTDAGVHALGQVAHTDIPEKNIFLSKNNFYLVSALNNFLNDTRVRILSIQKTTIDFDARFSALKRYYVYKFLFRSAPSALDNKRFWHVRKNAINIFFQVFD